jgi:cell wall-associated NlpC family hydrolase
VRVSKIKRAALVVLVGCLSVGVIAPPASAVTAVPTGRLMMARYNTFLHQLQITGWAYDPALPRASVVVRVYVDGSYAGRARADRPSPRVNRTFGIPGDHRFVITLPRAKRPYVVIAKTRGARASAPLTRFARKSVTRYTPPAGDRIVSVARKYVGYPYSSGGASPSGFDCSGFTMYVYARAHVRSLVHSAEGQRRSMRQISRSRARPGDLIFYMSGGSAYHVAIYAGHGDQYAAATPADGVRYQGIWSRSVVFGTDWH